ncbi:hypothetical protein DFA_02939 [Cavenderia fasciculata]|uniref:Uncharacterized protein n=1 Tax=Cavenderia fasciculata TaxID=261658 RepID=F4PG61_CACFS|nr:uncharacterized protein DFA_02939 [Cavenderia fasciculata]EGG24695.1 hypothetical protein DFA_02939 [Cavenderia fasciculata]|eukprot:XP_004362546.1 hypothetical protein DFA_02939 [Cavenderia fasciculata]
MNTAYNQLAKEQKFWEELVNLNLKDEGGVIQLPPNVHFLGNSTKPSSLYIRKCYIELKDIIFKDFEEYETTKTVLVSYTDQSKYKQFLKDASTTKRYLPPWDKMELDRARPLLYPYSIDLEDPEIDTHNSLQIFPIEVAGLAKYSQMELRFSSKYVAQIIVHQAVLWNTNKYQIRCLNTGEKGVLKVDKLPFINLNSSKSNFATCPYQSYFLPKTYSNFSVIDSMSNPNNLIKVTTSYSNPILMEEILEMIYQLGTTPPQTNLYFVVPDDMFNDFKVQEYSLSTKNYSDNIIKSITQYVLCFSLVSQ